MNTIKKKIAFTCGFAFTENFSFVALIHKNRGPVGMAGYWNGIGGKIEKGEGARGAQSREFHEETGLLVDPARWTTFHFERKILLPDIEPTIYFMTAVLTDKECHNIASTTDEEVSFHGIRQGYNNFHNLRWLIPMALDWYEYPTEQWIEG